VRKREERRGSWQMEKEGRNGDGRWRRGEGEMEESGRRNRRKGWKMGGRTRSWEMEERRGGDKDEEERIGGNLWWRRWGERRQRLENKERGWGNQRWRRDEECRGRKRREGNIGEGETKKRSERMRGKGDGKWRRQEVGREQGQVRIVHWYINSRREEGERRMIPVVHLTCEYLNELKKKFKITLMLFSGACREEESWKKPEAKNLGTLSL
jgi:ribonuclease E